MKLNQIEFETLWNIEKSWQTDPAKASNGTEENIKKYNKIFRKLNEIGLIRIEIRDNQIYGATVTDEGKQILEDKRYKKWIPE